MYDKCTHQWGEGRLHKINEYRITGRTRLTPEWFHSVTLVPWGYPYLGKINRSAVREAHAITFSNELCGEWPYKRKAVREAFNHLIYPLHLPVGDRLQPQQINRLTHYIQIDACKANYGTQLRIIFACGLNLSMQGHHSAQVASRVMDTIDSFMSGSGFDDLDKERLIGSVDEQFALDGVIYHFWIRLIISRYLAIRNADN